MSQRPMKRVRGVVVFNNCTRLQDYISYLSFLPLMYTHFIPFQNLFCLLGTFYVQNATQGASGQIKVKQNKDLKKNK